MKTGVKTRVFITRPAEDQQDFATLLIEAGFEPVAAPTIAIEAVELNQRSIDTLEALSRGEYSWLVFSSARGVQMLGAVIEESKGRFLLPESVRIGCQGGVTAENVRKILGRTVQCQPEVFVAEEFAAVLAQQVTEKDRVVIGAAQETRGVIEACLKKRGIASLTLPLYRTTARPLDPGGIAQLRADPTAYVCLMSPSAVRSLHASLSGVPKLFSTLRMVSIGPITSQAIVACGGSVALEASEYTAEGIVNALKRGS